jgi:hypothetical protein
MLCVRQSTVTASLQLLVHSYKHDGYNNSSVITMRVLSMLMNSDEFQQPIVEQQ